MGKENKNSRPKKYQCPLKECSKMYSRPCLLEQHRRTHSDERNFICHEPGCGKAFLRKSHLKVHKWSHSAEKPLSCEICYKGFTTSQQLSRHMNTHKKDKDCPYDCGKSYFVDKELTNHILEEHLFNEIIILQENPTSINTDHVPPSENYTLTTTTESCNLSTSDASVTSVSPLVNQESTLNLNDRFEPFIDLYCLEDMCKGYEPFESVFEIIQHYDQLHHFVPESYFYGFKTAKTDFNT